MWAVGSANHCRIRSKKACLAFRNPEKTMAAELCPDSKFFCVLPELKQIDLI